MPVNLFDCLIAIILFTSVPLQYFLVQNWGSSESSRSYALNRFLNSLSAFRDDYLNLESWKKWVYSQLGLKYKFYSDVTEDPDEGESPAVEVLQYKHKHGYFSFSPDPRLYRPPSVNFRVGQVVTHKLWKYRGVIVGWDEKAKAPTEWLDEMHGTENKEWREMPNYSILVDTRDRLTPQYTYVPQDNIQLVKNIKIIHPLLDTHFESFDGAQYTPRPWLKTLYPQD